MSVLRKQWMRAGSLLLAASLLAGAVPGEQVEAAKKAKLSQKKFTLTVGQKKTIRLKNKKKGKKYTFKSKKTKIAKVSKKGVVTAKKAGKTTITVKEVDKKKPKKTRTVGKVTVTVKKKGVINNPDKTPGQTEIQKSLDPTVSPTASPTPTPKTPWKAYEWQDYDLSARLEQAGTYDAAKGVLTLSDIAGVTFPLDTPLAKGQVLAVEIKAEITGKNGFQCWLTDADGKVQSDRYNASTDQDFAEGMNTLSFQVTAKNDAGYFRIAGRVENIQKMEIQSIKVRFTNELTVIPVMDPYAPAEEQAADTTDLKLTKSFSEKDGELVNNPLITQAFMADPAAIEVDGRLYVYGTADKMETDIKGRIKENGYKTSEIYCISSSDLVNWRDEGTIDAKAAASWVSNSWAPTICRKGEYFYLYFANGAAGIAVLRAKSPTGPWEDPIGKALINSSTPNCSSSAVPWLFDPSVLVDDDGTGYLYFGGGKTSGEEGASSPKSARVAKLGADMISLDGDPVQLEPAWLFEDNEINKINGTYYYSYCTNWNVPSDYGTFSSANIAYYTSDKPMTGFKWSEPAKVFANPGTVFGTYYNNHHKMVQFKDQWYMIYHTVILQENAYADAVLAKGNSGANYRCMHIDKLNVGTDGSLSATASYQGVEPVASLSPYEETSATTMAWNGGLKTVYSEAQKGMVLDSIHTGDWQGLDSVEFGDEGASSVKVNLASTTEEGKIEIYLDAASTEKGGKKVGEVLLQNTDGEDTYKTVSAALSEKVTGKHKVFFVFRGKGYHVASWQFEK